jgi:hypothetical protein
MGTFQSYALLDAKLNTPGQCARSLCNLTGLRALVEGL